MSKALDLDAILARANAATPGPWTAVDDTGVGGEDGEHVATVYTLGRHHHENQANRNFVTAARSDVPDLVAAVRDRDAEIATLKARLAMATTFEAHNGERVGVVMDRQNRRTGKWVALHAFDALKGDDGKVIQFEDADAAFAALVAYRARTTEKP